MNVKQGDLAIVVGIARRSPELTGRIVEVIRPVVEGEYIKVGDELARIRTNGEQSWIVRGVGGKLPMPIINENRVVMSDTRALADRFLRPVSGLPDVDTADTDQPVKIVEPA